MHSHFFATALSLKFYNQFVCQLDNQVKAIDQIGFQTKAVQFCKINKSISINFCRNENPCVSSNSLLCKDLYFAYTLKLLSYNDIAFPTHLFFSINYLYLAKFSVILNCFLDDDIFKQ